MVMMKRTQIYLTEAQVEVLGRIASATGVTTSDVVRQAIDSFLGANTTLSIRDFPDGGIVKVFGGKILVRSEE